jgi:hypothetical protein
MLNRLFEKLLTKKVSTFKDKRKNFNLSFPQGWYTSKLSPKSEYIFFEKKTNHGLIINLHLDAKEETINKILSKHKSNCQEDFNLPRTEIDSGYIIAWTYQFEKQKTNEHNKLIVFNDYTLEWSYCISNQLNKDDRQKAFDIEYEILNSIEIKNKMIEGKNVL